MLSRATATAQVSVTQASKIRRCAERRRVSDVRHPIKSIGPLRCTGRMIEVARSTSNSKTTNGIYVLKPKTHRPPRQPRCCKYSSGPPLAARGRPRNSGASAIQRAGLRGPLEVLETRGCVNWHGHTRGIARAPPLDPSGGERRSGARGRARPRRRLLPSARWLIRTARPTPRRARARRPA